MKTRKTTQKSPPGAQERRHAERIAVNLAGHVRIGGRRIAAKIVNISRTGALVEIEARVSVREAVTIEFPDRPEVRGRVVRVTSTYVAVTFEQPIELS
jgi:PilZ domain